MVVALPVTSNTVSASPTGASTATGIGRRPEKGDQGL
jgi:hypothetical protein